MIVKISIKRNFLKLNMLKAAVAYIAGKKGACKRFQGTVGIF
jgi:hypothetical protein